MNTLQQESEETVEEDTAFFEEARRWYSTVYLSVISERYFFIILTSISILTGLVALTAIIRLMPITPRVPFLYLADNAYEERAVIKPIKSYHTQDINDALRRFFLIEYVQQREGYSSTSVSSRLNFVRAHSSKEAFLSYVSFVDVRNPNSPLQQYGIQYVRDVDAEESSLIVVPEEGKPNYYRASVKFSASLVGSQASRTTFQRADIKFFYKDLIVAQTDDIDSEISSQVTPMRFLVTEYNKANILTQ